MNYLEIIVVIFSILVVLFPILLFVYKLFKKKPIGDCVCCPLSNYKNRIIKEYRKSCK